jgi:hypothetical protein
MPIHNTEKIKYIGRYYRYVPLEKLGNDVCFTEDLELFALQLQL